MPGPEQLRAQAATRARRAVTRLGIFAALFLAGVTWLLLSRPGAAPVTPTAEMPASKSSPSAGPVASAPVFVAPARWVTLPGGTRLVAELPVRFPHTPAGAASAAVASVQFGWTTDPAQAARVAAVYTAPHDAALVAAQAAETATTLRTRFGLPAAGALAPGAGVSVRAIGVQWRAASAGRVRVSVLAELRGQSAAGQPTGTELVAVSALMVWVRLDDGRDWKGTTTPARLPTPAPAELGTVAFNSAGWAAIQETRN